MTWVDACQQPTERAAISAIVLEKKPSAKSHYMKLNLTSDVINSDVGFTFVFFPTLWLNATHGGLIKYKSASLEIRMCPHHTRLT